MSRPKARNIRDFGQSRYRSPRHGDSAERISAQNYRRYHSGVHQESARHESALSSSRSNSGMTNAYMPSTDSSSDGNPSNDVLNGTCPQGQWPTQFGPMDWDLGPLTGSSDTAVGKSLCIQVPTLLTTLGAPDFLNCGRPENDTVPDATVANILSSPTRESTSPSYDDCTGPSNKPSSSSEARRRNSEASARFRRRRKEREVETEQLLRDAEYTIGDLKCHIKELYTENDVLRDLLSNEGGFSTKRANHRSRLSF